MIYDRICELCKEKGRSVSSVEKEAGLSNGTLRQWNGANPRVFNIQKVSEILGCDISDLISESGNNTSI